MHTLQPPFASRAPATSELIPLPTMTASYLAMARARLKSPPRSVNVRGSDEVQHLLGDAELAAEAGPAAVRRGPRADRERRPARLRRLLDRRALLLPEVLRVAGPDRVLRGRGAAHGADPVSHARPRAALPQPARAGVPDRLGRHPHRRPLRVRRRPRPRLGA